MVSLAKEREQLEVREKDMREMIAKAEEKRSWFAAFREWVENVATFLDEKVNYFYPLDTSVLIVNTHSFLKLRSLKKSTCRSFKNVLTW